MILSFDPILSGRSWLRRVLRVLTGVIVWVLVTGAGGSGRANQVTTAPNFGPYHASAGEFTVLPDPEVSALLGGYSPFTMNYVQAGTFQTFCVERGESLAPATTYDVTINNITMFSGVPLSAGAAYLYQQFARGNLVYNYADSPVGGRTTAGFENAWMLQNAIWFLMGDYSGQESNPYVLQAATALGGVAATFAPDNGRHQVSILNLWATGQPHEPQHAHQDLLIYNPVPEPSIAALLPLAALLMLCRRKS